MTQSRADWMTRADSAILEFLRNEGNEPLNGTPGMIELNIDYGGSHIRRRLRTLEKAGLVEYVDEQRGAYRISSTGLAYMRGNLDPEELDGLIDPD